MSLQSITSFSELQEEFSRVCSALPPSITDLRGPKLQAAFEDLFVRGQAGLLEGDLCVALPLRLLLILLRSRIEEAESDHLSEEDDGGREEYDQVEEADFCGRYNHKPDCRCHLSGSNRANQATAKASNPPRGHNNHEVLSASAPQVHCQHRSCAVEVLVCSRKHRRRAYHSTDLFEVSNWRCTEPLTPLRPLRSAKLCTGRLGDPPSYLPR